MATEKTQILTPVGRLINHALFEKDKFVDAKGNEGKPSYKIEMAFDPDDLKDLEDAIVDACVTKWGASAEKDYDEGKINSPILDGDDLAAKRVAKGKQGDAYVGKLVIRASTQFNLDGQDAPGGVYVAGDDGNALDFTQRGTVYQGCMGMALIEVNCYDPIGRDGKPGVNLYLKGFQWTGEGERLVSNSAAGAFKPVGRTASNDEGGSSRRRRAG